MYRNNEGYPDPTAGSAIRNIGRQEATERKRCKTLKANILHRPKVYVVSKFAGDVAHNIRQARKYCRFVAFKNCIPIASHLIYPQFLNDNKPKERELGLMFGLTLLANCEEVWCFGSEISSGMAQELQEAKLLNKPIRYFDECCEEVQSWDFRKN